MAKNNCVNIKSKEWFIDAEIIIKCLKNKIKIGDVEVEVLNRTEGKSNVRTRVIFDFMINMFKLIKYDQWIY